MKWKERFEWKKEWCQSPMSMALNRKIFGSKLRKLISKLELKFKNWMKHEMCWNSMFQCCQLNFAQNHGHWQFFAKKNWFLASFIASKCGNELGKIAKWPKLATFKLATLQCSEAGWNSNPMKSELTQALQNTQSNKHSNSITLIILSTYFTLCKTMKNICWSRVFKNCFIDNICSFAVFIYCKLIKTIWHRKHCIKATNCNTFSSLNREQLKYNIFREIKCYKPRKHTSQNRNCHTKSSFYKFV